MKLNFLCRFAGSLALALVCGACTIEIGPGKRTTENRFPDTAASVGSTGGQTPSDGNGGAGGGQDTASNSSASGTDDGTGGGWIPPAEETYCSDAEGSGWTASNCDELPYDSACPDVSAGNYAACQRAFALFNSGHAEDLLHCMANQPAAQLCTNDTVTPCLVEMYDAACTVPYIEQVCDSWATTCSEAGETLDAAHCKWDLNPFSDAGLGELAACMNSQPGDCQTRYDSCLAQVVQVEPVTAP